MRLSLLVTLVVVPLVANAQGTLRGRVRADSATPVANATVEVAGLTAQTDSAGDFVIRGIPAGSASIAVRAVGYKSALANMFVLSGSTSSHTFTLERLNDAQPLDAVKVTGAKPLGAAPRAFYERKELGIGRQYDREDLAKFDVGGLSQFMATVPGTKVAYGGRNLAFTTTRNPSGDKCAFCRSSPESLLTIPDLRAGFRPACYMDVYMNGMLVYQYGQTPPQPLFDFTTLRTTDFEAIEVYSSASQMPAQYNRTSAGCGAVLFWSRISQDKKP
jgi:hypothetical protein